VTDAPDFVELTPLDPRYPSRLREMRTPPPSLTTRGGSLEAERVVAIVGSRQCAGEARTFAGELAAELARAGAVVASGGAFGIDAAAHRGALAAGGRTWVVAGTGHRRCSPGKHRDLFETIGQGPGAMIWPFEPGYSHTSAFLVRNHVLAALVDAVVVIQAGLPSGALHAAGCARTARRPLWVVPTPPWTKGFEGSLKLLDEGAHPLRSTAAFLAALGLAQAPPAQPSRPLSESETAILRATSSTPLHLDEIASRAGAAAQAAAAALLTLALENVVVEGPPGFYRRRDSR
jgi:DNA processing protein